MTKRQNSKKCFAISQFVFVTREQLISSSADVDAKKRQTSQTDKTITIASKAVELGLCQVPLPKCTRSDREKL